MKKWLISLCMFLALAACDEKKETSQAENKPVIKIGVILPLTGSNSYMGEQMREGYEFVKEYQHPDINYKLLYVDDQQSPAKAAIAAKKLVEVDKVDALLTGTSQTASVVADTAANAKVIHLGISSDNRFTKKDYNYTMAPNALDEATVLLKHIKEQGYSRVAMITANEVFADMVEKNVTKLAEEYGIEIVFNAKITPGATKDYRILLRQAAETNPDIYVLQAWPPEIDILSKQLFEAVSDAKITSLYSFFISSNIGLYKGQFCLNIGTDDTKFKQAFYEKYGKGIEQMSATAFAQLSLILDMLQHKTESLNEVIAKHNGIFGKLSVDEKSIRYQPIVETIE